MNNDKDAYIESLESENERLRSVIESKDREIENINKTKAKSAKKKSNKIEDKSVRDYMLEDYVDSALDRIARESNQRSYIDAYSRL